MKIKGLAYRDEDGKMKRVLFLLYYFFHRQSNLLVFTCEFEVKNLTEEQKKAIQECGQASDLDHQDLSIPILPGLQISSNFRSERSSTVPWNGVSKKEARASLCFCLSSL